MKIFKPGYLGYASLCEHCGRNELGHEDGNGICYTKENSEHPKFKFHDRRYTGYAQYEPYKRRAGDECVEGCLIPDHGLNRGFCINNCECGAPKRYDQLFCGMCLHGKTEVLKQLDPQYKEWKLFKHLHCNHCLHLKIHHVHGYDCTECGKDDICGQEHPKEPHLGWGQGCPNCLPWPG